MNYFKILNKFSQALNYRLVQSGEGFTYRVQLYQNNSIKSFWHDVPIYPDQQNDTIINVGIEMPKDTLAKLEVSKTIANNPIVQDTKLNKRTGQQILRYYAQFASYNYGFIPQTWENSTTTLYQDKSQQYKGDNDPLDILEVSVDKVFVPGNIVKARVLGSFCVLDQDEVDWKIIVMNVDESDKFNIKTFQDYAKFNPDFQRQVMRRFRYIKTFDGKKENEILYNGEIFQVDKTLEIIKEGKLAYQELLKNPNLQNIRAEFKIAK